MDMYPINNIPTECSPEVSEPFPQPSSLKENPQPCVELT